MKMRVRKQATAADQTVVVEVTGIPRDIGSESEYKARLHAQVEACAAAVIALRKASGGSRNWIEAARVIGAHVKLLDAAWERDDGPGLLALLDNPPPELSPIH